MKILNKTHNIAFNLNLHVIGKTRHFISRDQMTLRRKIRKYVIESIMLIVALFTYTIQLIIFLRNYFKGVRSLKYRIQIFKWIRILRSNIELKMLKIICLTMLSHTFCYLLPNAPYTFDARAEAAWYSCNRKKIDIVRQLFLT